MKTLATLCAGLALLAPAMTHAQEAEDGFDLSAEARVLVESYDSGFRAGGPDSETTLFLRTRIDAAWRRGPLELGATLYDARAYGDDMATPISASDVDALELVQLYAALDVSESVRVTAGRQLFDLGSGRLLSNPGYRNAPNAFTGLRAEWNGGDAGTATIFYVLPQDRQPSSKADVVANHVSWDRESFDLELWGGIFARPIGAGLNAEVYVFGLDERDNARRQTRNRHLLTPGLRLFRKPARGKLDGEIEVAGQFGDIRTSTALAAPQVDVEAWTGHAEIGFSPDLGWRPRAALLADLATGDDATTPGYERFDPLYGPRRGDWGPTGTYGPLGRANVRSVGLKLEAKPSSRMDMFATWREVWLDSATDAFSFTRLTSATGAAGRDGGAQLEARLRWWVVPDTLRLELGGAVLMKGRFFDAFPTVPDGDTTFGYSALTVSF